jgi:hypothetical protein
MKVIDKRLIRYGALGSALLAGLSLQGQPVGQWDFNSGDLSATVGSPLQYVDGAGGPTSQGTHFGTTTALGIPNIGGGVANVMGFPAATNNMGFYMPTPANANGGGSLVNEYTLIMDVLYPSASDAMERPLLDLDLTGGPEFSVSATDGVGQDPSGPYDGTIAPNTWYRIGITRTATEQDTYINGVQVGTHTAGGLDDARYAMSVGSIALLLSSTGNSAAAGYVNSIQLWDVALNPGQMKALGGATAAGIPQTIPPVPSFIQTRSPGAGAVNAYPTPTVHVLLNQGDTTVTSSSIHLLLDGTDLGATITPTSPTFAADATVSTLLDPGSKHQLTLNWSDSVVSANSDSWTFTVLNYESINLPAPFYLENFDELAEGALPAGWVATNNTTPQTPGIDFCDATSDAYTNWVVINTNRLCAGPICAKGFECDTLNAPPIAVNGSLIGGGVIDGLGHNNILFFESDNRNNSPDHQIGMVFTADIDCTGKTNVYVGFNSLYLMNQDNIAALEYSVDQGTNWLPVLYYIADTDGTDPTLSDVITNSSGVIDAVATLNTVRSDQPLGTNYGYFICAPITQDLAPYIQPEPDDEASSVTTSDGVSHFAWIGKSIEVIQLPAADGSPHVRFRFVYAGTCSWYWGVDEFGLYSINTPVISSQPQSQAIDAGTPVTFTVGASSASSVTYQWKKNGTAITGATQSSYTIASVSTNDAAQYQVIVKNSDGPTPSALATLTVVTTPQITSQAVSLVVDAGGSFSLTPGARGGRPLTYLWSLNGTPVANSNTNSLTVASAAAIDQGSYQFVLTNIYGAVTSAVAEVTVVSGPITNNLVAHLPFDGNLNDTSGRGNNATYASQGAGAVATPTYTPGKIGQSFQYTVKNDASDYEYATFGYPTDLKFGISTSFSVSFWINYTNQADDPPFISNKDWDSSNNQGWGVFTQGDGAYRLQLTGPNGGADKYSIHPPTLLRDGNWHNLVMSVVHVQPPEVGYIYSYVDGVLASQGTMSIGGTIDTDGIPFSNHQSGVTPIQTAFAVNIGQDGTGVYYDNGGAHNIAAHIDDLGIWRRALSAKEAAAIYSAGQAGKDLSQAVVAPPGTTLNFTVSGGNINFTWTAGPTRRLQQAPALSSSGPSTWTDVAGTLGASSAQVPIGASGNAFFRTSDQ